MSELDEVVKQLKGGLDGIVKDKYSLEEWRYAFADIIQVGSMRILEEFPGIITGRPPARPASLGGPRQPGIDGERPPYHPNVCPIVCITLGNCPPPPT